MILTLWQYLHFLPLVFPDFFSFSCLWAVRQYGILIFSRNIHNGAKSFIILKNALLKTLQMHTLLGSNFWNLFDFIGVVFRKKVLECIYKPLYDYQNFSPLPNGTTDLDRHGVCNGGCNFILSNHATLCFVMGSVMEVW